MYIFSIRKVMLIGFTIVMLSNNVRFWHVLYWGLLNNLLGRQCGAYYRFMTPSVFIMMCICGVHVVLRTAWVQFYNIQGWMMWIFICLLQHLLECVQTLVRVDMLTKICLNSFLPKCVWGTVIFKVDKNGRHLDCRGKLFEKQRF